MKTGSRNKAKVAIANRMARAIYCILSGENVCYKELSSNRVINSLSLCIYDTKSSLINGNKTGS